MNKSPGVPYLQYKSALARELAKPPHNWVGGSAWRLIELFEESIAHFWNNDAPIDSLATTISTLYMEANSPSPFRHPTKEGLEKAGCIH